MCGDRAVEGETAALDIYAADVVQGVLWSEAELEGERGEGSTDWEGQAEEEGECC